MKITVTLLTVFLKWVEDTFGKEVKDQVVQALIHGAKWAWRKVKDWIADGGPSRAWSAFKEWLGDIFGAGGYANA